MTHNKPTIIVRDATKDPAFPSYRWSIRLPKYLRRGKVKLAVKNMRRWPRDCHSRDAAFRVAYQFITSSDWDILST